MPPPTRPGPSHGMTLRLTVSTGAGAASDCVAPLPAEPLVISTIAPVTATAVPAIPHTMATKLAVFPDDCIDGSNTGGLVGLDSWVSLSPKFLARIPSMTATTSAATPSPTIVQPTPRRAFEGGVGGTTTTTGGATGGGVTTGAGVSTFVSGAGAA